MLIRDLHIWGKSLTIDVIKTSGKRRKEPSRHALDVLTILAWEDAFIQLEEIQTVSSISQGIPSPKGYYCTVITH